MLPKLKNYGSARLSSLKVTPRIPVLIIGGGVQGAEISRVLSHNQIPCVLAERGDWASATSQSSSKMLHGGLRYLENADISQVREGVRARDDQFRTAPHLCRRMTFAVPLRARFSWQRAKLGLGLALYDSFGGSSRHRFVNAADPELAGAIASGLSVQGAYLYEDGVTDDARMVIEALLEAQAKGAQCYNYLEVVQISRRGDHYVVRCLDRICNEELQIEALILCNCAGPWVAEIGAPECEPLRQRLRYSAGAHLLFDRPWSGPALCLPIQGEYSRYYFVWPHPGGTLVGTTEREVDSAEQALLPTPDEVTQILERLAHDLPQSGLARSSLYYGFAGIRTLPLRDENASTARLSRRPMWIWTDGILSLVGGKLTTAKITASEGGRQIAARLGFHAKWRSLQGVPYPGAGTPEAYAQLTAALVEQGLSAETAACIVGRYGVRAQYWLEARHRLAMLTPSLTAGEVEIAVREEQAVGLEDILRRRTGLEYLPGRAPEAVDPVCRWLADHGDSALEKGDIDAYGLRWQQLQRQLGMQG